MKWVFWIVFYFCICGFVYALFGLKMAHDIYSIMPAGYKLTTDPRVGFPYEIQNIKTGCYYRFHADGNITPVLKKDTNEIYCD